MADPQVTFNYALWVARYPELSEVPEPTAQLYFDEATLYHRNNGTLGYDDAQQLTLLNMLAAHIALLGFPFGGAALSPLIGPITNASEGSVSVGVRPFDAPGTQAWFLTTRYGSSYWFITAPRRTMRYRPGPRRTFNTPWPYTG